MENIFKSFNGVVAIIATALTYVLGGWDIALAILVVFLILDYISGVLKAIINKELSSAIGFAGIAKKVYIIVLVGVGYGIDRLMGNEALIFRTVTCYLYMANEGVSILENASLLGLPVSTQLQDKLLQLKGKSQEHIKND